jgi:hypothetical protein
MIYIITEENLINEKPRQWRGPSDDHAKSQSGRNNAHKLAILRTFLLEFYNTVAQGKQGMVTSATHAYTGVNPGATLTDNDAAGCDCLSAIDLDAKTLRL